METKMNHYFLRSLLVIRKKNPLLYAYQALQKDHRVTKLPTNNSTHEVVHWLKQRCVPGSSPLEGEDGFPVFLRHVFDVLNLIQDQVPPPPLQEVTLVLQQQLVGGHTHMEAVGVPPPLEENQQHTPSYTAIRLHEADSRSRSLNLTQEVESAHWKLPIRFIY